MTLCDLSGHPVVGGGGGSGILHGVSEAGLERVDLSYVTVYL